MSGRGLSRHQQQRPRPSVSPAPARGLALEGLWSWGPSQVWGWQGCCCVVAGGREAQRRVERPWCGGGCGGWAYLVLPLPPPRQGSRAPPPRASVNGVDAFGGLSGCGGPGKGLDVLGGAWWWHGAECSPSPRLAQDVPELPRHLLPPTGSAGLPLPAFLGPPPTSCRCGAGCCSCVDAASPEPGVHARCPSLPDPLALSSGCGPGALVRLLTLSSQGRRAQQSQVP